MVLSCSWTGKKKNALENSLGFQAQIDDLRLKGGILGKFLKTTVGGRTRRRLSMPAKPNPRFPQRPSKNHGPILTQ
jgi:hypothetical protein